ncbi:ABC transporter ATP-binding protein [Nonomuraea sp. NPDC046802]|uniref:ABC transporter ATP-binding protein n=1 Tax=Nonomuraea sp. NPDC046802 TaxID=3154919 RepID=UPI0033DDF973
MIQARRTIKISIRNVTKTFQAGDEPFAALSGLDLDIHEGEFLAIVGPSGCGKSTLLDLIAGLSAPTSGEIDGAPGADFQQYALFPWRTAQANVEFGLEARAVPGRERARRAREHLALVGLGGFESRYPYELSDGMRLRVAIARSLAFDQDVLLMDEPFAALDARTRRSLQDDLLRVWRHTGKTVVLVTHGIDEAVRLGQRVAVMTSRPGRIKEMVDVTFDSRAGDPRADPAFREYRHRVWSLLRDEMERKVAITHG